MGNHRCRSIITACTLLVTGVLLGTSLAGCSQGSSSSNTSLPEVTGPTTTTTAVPTTTTTTTTTTTEQPGWTPVSTVNGSIAVDQKAITGSDGNTVTVVRFRAGRVRFNLHVGSTDPPTGSATIGRDAGSAIGSGETPLLLAAFNGGFESNTGAGGFELNGQVLLPLVAGTTSLVIDANGAGHVGVWGQNTPAPGEQVVSVRQNLVPLVAGGQPSPAIDNIGAWGATLGGGSMVARSSLGEDSSGNLMYAAGMRSLPKDLANALIDSGSVTAMELDINPEWVQLAFAALPGLALATAIPGQVRPADQFQVGWTRDFVTVLTTS
jgi:hypothetical protein